jgi:AAA+ superfamily predicted ATPase
MNQENKKTNKLNKITAPFHTFIDEEMQKKSLTADPEILAILLQKENWEKDNTIRKTETEIKNRVQNWVMYDPEKDKVVYTGLELVKYEVKNGVVNSYHSFVKNVVRFKVFKALLGTNYDQIIKGASRGRATNMPEVIIENVYYWPKYFKAYGVSGITDYLLNVLDYRRVFQLSFYFVIIGGVFSKAAYLLNVEKNQPRRFLPLQDFTVAAKSTIEQTSLLKGKLGKRVLAGTDSPLLHYFSHDELTNIQQRTKFSGKIDGYPFSGVKPEISKDIEENFDDDLDNFNDDSVIPSRIAEKYPTAPMYELFNSEITQEMGGIKKAASITNYADLEQLVETKQLSANDIFAPPGFNKNNKSAKTKKTSFVPKRLTFFRSGLVKNIYPNHFSSGPFQDWNVDQSQLIMPGVEISSISPMLEPELHAIKPSQIRDASLSLNSDKLMGHYLSNSQIFDEFPKRNPSDNQNWMIDPDDEEVWEDTFNSMATRTLGLKLSDEDELEEHLTTNFTSTVTTDLPYNRDPDSISSTKSIIRLMGDPDDKIVTESDLLSIALPTVFLWYMAYNLYRFRLHFIYDVRKKPLPVLYNRLDHYGRLRNKVQLKEVMGINGSREKLEKLFSALQRARGMGIYIPTVILSAWESTFGALIPSSLDQWVVKQRNQISMLTNQTKIDPTQFANREPSLSENIFNLNDSSSTFEPRFKLLKSTIQKEQQKLNKLEQGNVEYKIQTQLKTTAEKLAALSKFVMPKEKVEETFSLKNFIKFNLKNLLFIENELSNVPVIAAFKPGRYALNDLPKGMLLVGDPGNGRSFLARAIASETRLPFFKTESNRFIDPKFGVLRLMALFRRVRNQAPGVLFIRDIDLITVDRERTNSPELIQLTTQFLICFDGYYIGSESRPTKRKIFTLGSVSDLRKMDPACLRSGRFEWIVNLRKPVLGERKFLLQNKATKSRLKLENDIAWNYFDLMTDGFTHAEVVSLINSSSLQAIRTNTLIHTNSSLNDALRNIFTLRDNKTVNPTIDEGFFNKLHHNGLIKPDVANFENLEANGIVPFKTKCIHLLASVKNWQTATGTIKTPPVVTMQNIGVNVQKPTDEYSQRLMNELLGLLAESAFLKQLRRCGSMNTFVTQTSYCENLAKQLNGTFAEGCETYRLERTIVNFQEAQNALSSLAATSNWQTGDSLYLNDLRHRTKLLGKWYRSRMFYELETYERVSGISKKSVMSASMVRLKERIIGRLYEFTQQQPTPYSVTPTICGTYGTRDFKTNVKRPEVGSVTQVSNEFLQIHVK